MRSTSLECKPHLTSLDIKANQIEEIIDQCTFWYISTPEIIRNIKTFCKNIADKNENFSAQNSVFLFEKMDGAADTNETQGFVAATKELFGGIFKLGQWISNEERKFLFIKLVQHDRYHQVMNKLVILDAQPSKIILNFGLKLIKENKIREFELFVDTVVPLLKEKGFDDETLTILFAKVGQQYSITDLKIFLKTMQRFDDVLDIRINYQAYFLAEEPPSTLHDENLANQCLFRFIQQIENKYGNQYLEICSYLEIIQKQIFNKCGKNIPLHLLLFHLCQTPSDIGLLDVLQQMESDIRKADFSEEKPSDVTLVSALMKGSSAQSEILQAFEVLAKSQNYNRRDYFRYYDHIYKNSEKGTRAMLTTAQIYSRVAFPRSVNPLFFRKIIDSAVELEIPKAIEKVDAEIQAESKMLRVDSSPAFFSAADHKIEDAVLPESFVEWENSLLG